MIQHFEDDGKLSDTYEPGMVTNDGEIFGIDI